MFKIKTENHSPQILPSLEHHCSCILIFLSKVHTICSVSGAFQGYADPTGHSEALLFPEYVKSKAPWPFRLGSYSQQNNPFPLSLALNKSKLGVCSSAAKLCWGPIFMRSWASLFLQWHFKVVFNQMYYIWELWRLIPAALSQVWTD